MGQGNFYCKQMVLWFKLNLKKRKIKYNREIIRKKSVRKVKKWIWSKIMPKILLYWRLARFKWWYSETYVEKGKGWIDGRDQNDEREGRYTSLQRFRGIAYFSELILGRDIED